MGPPPCSQVLAAFPDDGIVDSLPLADVAVLVDADADLDTGGLGLGSLRDTLAGLGECRRGVAWRGVAWRGVEGGGSGWGYGCGGGLGEDWERTGAR